ncbi:MAG: amidohydrolase family protein, partial [Candidatus Hydrogenedentes bacterium]|nr:amidohydrolase family protein [Candidatus Hydrogenedentota bacterium]
PWVATASDAGVTLPGDGLVHARYYGTFPRKIRKYALNSTNPVLPLGQAIRSMTSFPATIMGFQERGRIKVGYNADIVVLDLEAVRDAATFFEPHQYAKGIPFVMINGTFVVENSAPTFALPGSVLLRPAPRDRQDTDD